MSFLAPLFLFGALSVAVPILVHLRRRKSQQRFAFPSLMFLEEVPHATIRRRRLRDLPLLALRALAVLLLALAFAQPALRGHLAGNGEGAREVFLLVDRSASMTIGSRWQAAEEAVERALAGLSSGDLVTLALFDEVVEIPVSSSGDPTLVLDALRAAQPRDRRTSLSAGLRVLRPLLLTKKEDGNPRGAQRTVELIVVSDFQRNGVEETENLRLPGGVGLVLLNVTEGEAGSSSDTSNGANRWVQRVTLERGGESAQGGGSRERVRVVAMVGSDLAGTPESRTGIDPAPEVEVALWIDGRQVQQQQIRLEGRATPVLFKDISLDSQRTVQGEVRISPDFFPRDDTFYFTASAADAITVVLGTGRNQAAGLYVQRSLESSRSPRYKVLRIGASEISQVDLEAAHAVVVADAGTLSLSSLVQLERFVRAGGGLLVAYGPQAIGKALPSWLEMRADLAVGQSRSGIRLATVDGNHPVFSSIQGAEWGIAPFFRSFDLSTPASLDVEGSASPVQELSGVTLARFSDGSVAMAERRIGDGKVLGFGSTLDTAWNEFPRHSAFLAWLDQALQHLVTFTPAEPSYTVGEPALIGVDGSSKSWIVVGPDGESFPVRPGGERRSEQQEADRSEEQLLLTFEESGHSSLRVAGSTADLGQWFAVNLDRRESELETADLEILRAQLTADLTTPGASGDAEVEATPRGVWWLVLYSVLLLLVSEGVVASRRRTATLEAI